MDKVKGPERTQQMVDALREWQATERHAIEQTALLMEKTKNPLIRQILEIIRNDSVQHHRVQQFIIDTLTITPISLTPEELGEIWDAIEEHDATEKKALAAATHLRDESRSIVQRALLDYLLYDEQKHDMLLGELSKFKKGLYPYA